MQARAEVVMMSGAAALAKGHDAFLIPFVKCYFLKIYNT